jgi:hypothetical protein
MTISASGAKLPLLFIGAGKTERALKWYCMLFNGRKDVLLQTENGWMNTHAMMMYLDEIFEPRNGDPCALIMDNFSAHIDDQVMTEMKKLHIEPILVPPNCTWQFQPLDVKVNGAIKAMVGKQHRIYRSTHMNEPLNKKHAIMFTMESWRRLSAKAIRSAWMTACGVSSRMLQQTEPSGATNQAIHGDGNRSRPILG